MTLRKILDTVIIRKSLVVLADQCIFTGSNFFTGIIIARVCGKECLGLYALGWSFVIVATELQSSLILSPYTAFGARLTLNDHSSYITNTIIHHFVLDVLSAIVLAGIAVYIYSSNINTGLDKVLCALSLVVMFILLRIYARQICLARLHENTAFAIDFSVALIQISGLLILSHFKALSVRTAIYTIGCACAAPSVIWLVRVRDLFSIPAGRMLSDLKLNMTFGGWVLGGNMLVLISNQLYLWVLMMFCGIKATGALAAYTGVVGIFNPVRAGIGNIIGPRSAHSYAKSGTIGLNKITLAANVILSASAGLFCLGIFFEGDNLVRLLYGSAFVGNRTVITILALSVLASAISAGIDYWLWAVGRADKNFMANLCSFGIALTLGVYFVSHMGLLGVGLGMLISNTGASTTRYILYKQQKRALSLIRLNSDNRYNERRLEIL